MRHSQYHSTHHVQRNKSKTSLLTLITIVGFSVGLLTGYLVLGSPRTEEHFARRRTVEFGHSETRSLPHEHMLTGQEKIEKKVEISDKDARHPANIRQIMKEQSHVHEQKHEMLSTIVSQQSSHDEADVQVSSERNAKELQKKAMKEQHSAQSEAGNQASKINQAKKQIIQQQSQASETVIGSHAATKIAHNRPEGKTIHTLFTSNGSPYQNFQARIMVATYNIVRKQPGGEHMVALTRILHRTKPDELMDEIPTYRANPLQPECDTWCWFPVADRANAVQQWIDAAEKDSSLVKGAWLLMLETDYVWRKPMPVPGDAWDPIVPGLSFSFDYIGSRGNPYVKQLVELYCLTCDPLTVPNSGPAPVLLRFNDLKLATPIWENATKWIETHETAKKALGWVREMYAWDVAVAVNKLNILNQGVKDTPLISQPPHDSLPYNTSMYHYTWGSIFKEADKEIWKFDKRFYTSYEDAMKIPQLPLPPPWHEGIRLQDGLPVSKDMYNTILDMVQLMNTATKTLPNLLDKSAKATAGTHTIIQHASSTSATVASNATTARTAAVTVKPAGTATTAGVTADTAGHVAATGTAAGTGSKTVGAIVAAANAGAGGTVTATNTGTGGAVTVGVTGTTGTQTAAVTTAGSGGTVTAGVIGTTATPTAAAAATGGASGTTNTASIPTGTAAGGSTTVAGGTGTAVSNSGTAGAVSNTAVTAIKTAVGAVGSGTNAAAATTGTAGAVQAAVTNMAATGTTANVGTVAVVGNAGTAAGTTTIVATAGNAAAGTTGNAAAAGTTGTTAADGKTVTTGTTGTAGVAAGVSTVVPITAATTAAVTTGAAANGGSTAMVAKSAAATNTGVVAQTTPAIGGVTSAANTIGSTTASGAGSASTNTAAITNTVVAATGSVSNPRPAATGQTVIGMNTVGNAASQVAASTNLATAGNAATAVVAVSAKPAVTTAAVESSGNTATAAQSSTSTGSTGAVTTSAANTGTTTTVKAATS